MANLKKSCQTSSCQSWKVIQTVYACSLEGLCVGKWWWSFVSHKWVILKNENVTLHVAGCQLDTIKPRKYKAQWRGGGRTEVDALPPILQRKFWGEVFRYNAESVFSCSFILCRIFDMSNECPWWMTLPWQPSNYMYVMHKIDSFGITLYSRHNWSMINDINGSSMGN